ncbi:MAG: hypothetical protein ACI956_002220, partial [Nonlabens sp.]
MIKYTFPIILLALFFSSCDGSFFETTLEVDPPLHTPEITVHSFIKPGDSVIGVSVGKSFGLLETVSYNEYEEQFLKGATVEIFQQGALKYTLIPFEDLDPNPGNFLPLNYGLELDEPIGGIGDSFEIKVKHPDFEAVTSVQYMPAPVQVTRAKFIEDGGIGEGADRLNSIDITFTDPAGIENYYEIWVAYKENGTSGETYFNSIYMGSNDPILRRGGEGDRYLFRDRTIDGKEYIINLQLDDEFSDNMVVVFRSVTEDWFLYA